MSFPLSLAAGEVKMSVVLVACSSCFGVAERFVASQTNNKCASQGKARQKGQHSLLLFKKRPFATIKLSAWGSTQPQTLPPLLKIFSFFLFFFSYYKRIPIPRTKPTEEFLFTRNLPVVCCWTFSMPANRRVGDQLGANFNDHTIYPNHSLTHSCSLTLWHCLCLYFSSLSLSLSLASSLTFSIIHPSLSSQHSQGLFFGREREWLSVKKKKKVLERQTRRKGLKAV